MLVVVFAFYLSHVMRKPAFAYLYAKTKAQNSCAVNAPLISAFDFATHIYNPSPY